MLQKGPDFSGSDWKGREQDSMNIVATLRPAEAETRARIAALAASSSYEISARDWAGFKAAHTIIPPDTMVAIIWTPKDEDDDRVAMAYALARAGFRPIPHIAARAIESEDALDRLLGRLADEAGVARAFVIGGDCTQTGPFSCGFDAIATGLFARHGFKAIGLPGYPEGHPAISDPVLIRDLQDKLALVRDAGMEPLVLTQFGFDAEPIAGWLARLRIDEPDLPVRIGLAGPARTKTLLRYAALCGVEASARGLKRIGSSITRILTETGPDPVIRALAEGSAAIEEGPTALHIFPFGGLAKSVAWASALAEGAFEIPESGAALKFLR
jgi:methylenetetrahydrofolate reductase (NADPH)